MHRKQTKEADVAERLREAVLSGRMRRGERVNQAELAASMRVSITPVREAVRHLVAEGCLDDHPLGGVCVPVLDRAALAEVVDLRVALETRLVVAAMRRLTLRELGRLRTLEADFELAAGTGDRGLAQATNFRFHHFLRSSADLPQTARFATVLWARYPFEVIARIPGRLSRATAEHGALVDAVLARDEDATANAVRLHIEAAWRDLQSVEPYATPVTT